MYRCFTLGTFLFKGGGIMICMHIRGKRDLLCFLGLNFSTSWNFAQNGQLIDPIILVPELIIYILHRLCSGPSQESDEEGKSNLRDESATSRFLKSRCFDPFSVPLDVLTLEEILNTPMDEPSDNPSIRRVFC